MKLRRKDPGQRSSSVARDGTPKRRKRGKQATEDVWYHNVAPVFDEPISDDFSGLIGAPEGERPYEASSVQVTTERASPPVSAPADPVPAADPDPVAAADPDPVAAADPDLVAADDPDPVPAADSGEDSGPPAAVTGDDAGDWLTGGPPWAGPADPDPFPGGSGDFGASGRTAATGGPGAAADVGDSAADADPAPDADAAFAQARPAWMQSPDDRPDPAAGAEPDAAAADPAAAAHEDPGAPAASGDPPAGPEPDGAAADPAVVAPEDPGGPVTPGDTPAGPEADRAQAPGVPGAAAQPAAEPPAPQRPFVHDGGAPPAAEPPMIIPVRAYYMTRPDDTLRSVSAQFLNTPSRWQELRSLNAASPGVAGTGADALLPAGTALALPGDPLPWGRPDPVYLWTLAERFLYAAWGRDPTPEEVVPFWRGLTGGAGQLDAGPAPPPALAEPAEPPIPPAMQPPQAPPAEAPTPVAAEPLAPPAPAAETSSVHEPPPAEAPSAPPAADATPAPPPAVDESAPPYVSPPAVEEPDAPVPPPAADATPAPPPAGEAAPSYLPPAAEKPAPPAASPEPPAAPPYAEAAYPPPPVGEEEAVEAPAGETSSVHEPPPAEAPSAPPAADATPAPPPAVDESAPPYVSPPAVEEPDAPVPPPAPPVGPPFAESPPYPEPPAAPPYAEAAYSPPPPAPPFDEPAAPPYPEAPHPEPPAAPPYAEAAYPPPPPVGEEGAVEAPAPSAYPPPASPTDLSAPATEPAPPAPPPAATDEPRYEPPTTPAPGAGPMPGMPDLGPVQSEVARGHEAEGSPLPAFMPSLTGATPSAELPVEEVVASTQRVLAGTAIGDAMMLWQLGRLRRRRGGRRSEAAPDPLELSLEQTARMDSLRLIEAAMRHLRASTVAQLRPKPRVICVRTGAYGFELLLEEPVEAPAGWQAASGGYVLELPRDVTVEQLDAAGPGPSLCPALVPVGDTAEGPLLLNLEEIGCLAVSGPSNPAASLLTSVVEVLGSSPLAGDIRIITVGLSSPTGPGWERIHAISYDSPQLEHLLSTADSPGHAGTGSADVLVIGPGNDLLFQRAGQIATAPGSRLMLVGATSSVAARWPWRIHVDEQHRAVVHPIAVNINAAQAMRPELAYLLSEAGDDSPTAPRLP